MSGTVKRALWFKLHHYKDIEIKLEKLAAKGLILKECGPYLWTFRKEEPKKLKYTVTYFSEGSLFNPGITENQQTYFDYAKASGWNFIAQINQMQIFCSEADDPVPFETDEKEKFENIKKCMRKSFLPSMILMILVFSLNLFVQFHSFRTTPIDFFANTNQLFPCLMMFTACLYSIYSLIDYWIWCKRSDRSIATGGECHENANGAPRVIDVIFLCATFGSLGWFLIQLVAEKNWFPFFIVLAQMPILIFLFWSSICYWKKKKVSAMKNRVLSCALLLIATFSYMAFIIVLIIRFDFGSYENTNYRTVTWEISPTITYDYRLYRDEIPLTCEDLYGAIDYDYYSYKAAENSSMFLAQKQYWQDSLPARDAPPRIEYEILKPQFRFVYALAKKQLLTIPAWQENQSITPIDAEPFGAIEAYQKQYEDSSTGNYLLFFADQMIELDLQDPATPEQIAVIRKKLQL